MSQVYLGSSSTPSVPTSFQVKVAGTLVGTSVPAGNIEILNFGYTEDNNENGLVGEVPTPGGNQIDVLLTNRFYAEVTTTNSTPTEIWSYNLGASAQAYRFFAKVVCRNTGALEVSSYDIDATFMTDGATATRVDTPDSDDQEDAALAAASIDMVASGNTASLQVTGIAATNISWAVVGNYIQI